MIAEAYHAAVVVAFMALVLARQRGDTPRGAGRLMVAGAGLHGHRREMRALRRAALRLWIVAVAAAGLARLLRLVRALRLGVLLWRSRLRLRRGRGGRERR